MDYFLNYLAIINVAGFVLFGYDKFLAKARQRRIRERTLMTVAALGGSAGSWAGMLLFRHKTRKLKFKLGVPLLLILQAALYVLYRVYAAGALF